MLKNTKTFCFAKTIGNPGRPLRSFWSVVMMIHVRGENGGRGNGILKRLNMHTSLSLFSSDLVHDSALEFSNTSKNVPP